MVNVIAALKICGQLWVNKLVEIFCDNRTVVDLLSFGKARDLILVAFAGNIWLLSSMYNIKVVVSHVRGSQNTVAELLSIWRGINEDYI